MFVWITFLRPWLDLKRTSPQESKNLSCSVPVFCIIVYYWSMIAFRALFRLNYWRFTVCCCCSSFNSWHLWYFKRSASQESNQSTIATSTGSNCTNSWQCSFQNPWLSLPQTSWTWCPCRWKAQPYPSHPSNCTDLFVSP